MAVALEQPRLLWLGEPRLPDNVSAAVNGQWDVVACRSRRALARRLGDADLVVIAPPRRATDPRWLTRALDEVDRSRAVAIVLLPRSLRQADVLRRRTGQHVCLDADASPTELAACLAAAAALQPAIRGLQDDVARLRGRASEPDDVEVVNEELRLAARLQRDFLPRDLPLVPPLHCSALYRPAGWLSGDLYDVFRLDEHHVGFYVADVVGHGLPAALLTMFIKKALQTKRIFDHTYEIVAPDAALSQLNDDICRQELRSCQFCTAVYGVLDLRTLTLEYARGGHPVPLLLRADGTDERLDATGALLGVFPGERFERCEVRLAPGDRLLVFSDGLEDTLSPRPHPPGEALLNVVRPLRRLPGEEMLLHLAELTDAAGPTARRDDVTVLVLDVSAE